MPRSTDINQVLDLSDLRAVADELEQQIAPLTKEREALSGRIMRLQRLVNDLRREADVGSGRLFPAPPAEMPKEGPSAAIDATPNAPGTQTAIVRILDEASGAMTAGAIYDEMERRGWLPRAANPRNALRTSLWNLAKKNAIRRLGESPADRVWAAWNGTDPDEEASAEDQ